MELFHSLKIKVTRRLKNWIFLFRHAGHEKIVNLLIRNAADTTVLTPERLTALDLAKEKGTPLTFI